MKKRSKKASTVITYAIGLAVSAGSLLILMVIFSLISSKVGMTDGLVSILSIVISILSWGIGAFVVGYKNRKNGILSGVIHGGSLLVLLILISFAFHGGNTALFSGKFLIYLLVGMLISCIGSVLGVHFALKRR